MFAYACSNYEQIVKAHQDNPQEGDGQVTDQVKFGIFQSIMDCLFQSFSTSVSVSSFQELSACVFSWIEEHCKPQVTPQWRATTEPLPGSRRGMQKQGTKRRNVIYKNPRAIQRILNVETDSAS